MIGDRGRGRSNVKDVSAMLYQDCRTALVVGLLKMDANLPDDERRFTIELEFVQCLANPEFLHWLAQNRYLEDKAFLGFLKYLSYWRRPEYSRYILYPHCLAILDLLEDENFRAEVSKVTFKDFLDNQQFLHWRFYLNSRRDRMTTTRGGTWTMELNESPPDAAGEAGDAAVSAEAVGLKKE